MKILFFTLSVLFFAVHICAQAQNAMTYEQYIARHLPDENELNIFLKSDSWAKFDSDLGYTLGNYIPHDGIDGSSTISTAQKDGSRTSFMYNNVYCRINTYGDSFTQCHQVSDGETWQEYLAGHLGEPVRNFGVGGYGAYQSYRRLIKEESSINDSNYVIFYIWGDDHIRSLLRCRYILTSEWTEQQRTSEGEGVMFHGNFWPNLEIDLKTGKWVERNNPLQSPESLHRMRDKDWMIAQLKNDYALQMSLYLQNKINLPPRIEVLKMLSKQLNFTGIFDQPDLLRENIRGLLNCYAFAATKYILQQLKAFTENRNKKLMVVIFDPYLVLKPMLSDKNATTRYDQDIVDYLRNNKFNYFDMNLVHKEDFKQFNLSPEQYFSRYFIGHYNPMGNHFFAYSIKARIVEWLQKKPITYSGKNERAINFKNYLQGY